jgi:hypothetical protein
MLARGEALSAVVGSFCGYCSSGRAAQAAWLAYLARLPTLHSRRQHVEHFLRTFNGAVRHGSQWRVVDWEGFVGRQHVLVPHVVEVIDPESGEVFEQHTGKLRRAHCPAESAGGLGAEQHRAPRSLNRYRASMREGGLINSRQPPAGAQDAKRPRSGDGRWAYAQHWLRLPPTPEMLRRWGARTVRVRQPMGEVPAGPFSAAQPPRADDLQALAELAERFS